MAKVSITITKRLKISKITYNKMKQFYSQCYT